MLKVCEYCGKEFETNNKRIKYCCRRCKDNIAKERAKLKKCPETGTYICQNCGKEFHYVHGQEDFKHKNTSVCSYKYCCAKCGIEYMINKAKNTKQLHFEQDSLYKEKIQNKRKNTCLKQYGVDCISKSPNIKVKTKETNLKRYGNANGIDFSKIDYESRAKKN